MTYAAVLITTLIAACGGTVAASPEPADRGGPAQLIYDSDLDFDDASVLAYLCQEHKRGRVVLRAVTITNNGIGAAGRSLTHARTILEGCGLPDVPIADASHSGGNPAPPEAREMFERVLTGALGDGGRPNVPAPIAAPDLIARTLLGARGPVSILTTGPLSNVASAIRGRPDVARKIARLYAMGGAFGVPGNLFGSTTNGFDNTQEVNRWIDPDAAGEVFAGVPAARVHIVSLDATNHAPITAAFVARLGADATTYEARVVHAIITQPDLPPLIELGVMFWWDALAAVSLTRDAGVVQFRPQPVDVVRTGPSAGRTIITPQGTLQRPAVGADAAAFERLFLDGLNGR